MLGLHSGCGQLSKGRTGGSGFGVEALHFTLGI